MKVYVVSLTDEDGTDIQGVFGNRKLAGDYIDNHPAGAWREYKDVEKWEINSEVPERGAKELYYINILKEGPPEISIGSMKDAETELSKPSIGISYDRTLEMSWAVLAENRLEAEKLAIEVRDRWVAEGRWRYEE